MAGILNFYGYGEPSTPLLSAKQKQEAIDKGQDEKIEGLEKGGGAPKESMIETTYFELVKLRDDGKLIPGCHYRITDYETKIPESEYVRTTDHKFDIVVLATSNDTISDKAHAVQHDGEDYFNGCNLSAWELKYEFDNMYFPDDGKKIFIEDGGDLVDLNEAGFVELDSGTFCMAEIFHTGPVSMKCVGNGNVVSGGTFALSSMGSELWEKVGSVTVESGGTFCVGYETGFIADKRISRFQMSGKGNATSEMVGTYGIFKASLFGQEISVLAKKTDDILEIQDEECAFFNLDVGVAFYVPKTGTLDVSGTTYTLWAPEGYGGDDAVASNGEEVGSKAYMCIDGEINFEREFTIVSKTTVKGGEYQVWTLGDIGLPIAVIMNKDPKVGTAYAFIAGTYLPGEQVSAKTVKAGDEFTYYEGYDHNNNSVEAISFKNTVGSILYYVKDNIIVPGEYSSISSIETIEDNSECTLWRNVGGELVEAISKGETVGSLIFFAKSARPILDASSAGIITAADIVNDGDEYFIWDGDLEKSFSFSKEPNSALYGLNYSLPESAQTIQNADGLISEVINIPDGTKWMLWSYRDGLYVSENDEIGTFIYPFNEIDGVDFSQYSPIFGKKVVYSGGKGTITKMVDENNNSLPYDFKNIQFKRWAVSDEEIIEECGTPYIAVKEHVPMWYDPRGGGYPMVDVVDDDFIWCYTFSNVTVDEENNVTVKGDATINTQTPPKNNEMIISDDGLANNVFYCVDEIQMVDNKIVISQGEYGVNTALPGFKGNTINRFELNIISNGFENNKVDELTNNVIHGDFNFNNINVFTSNRVLNDFSHNKIRGKFGVYNNVGYLFSYNTIDGNISSFSFGDNVQHNYFGGDFGQTYKRRNPYIQDNFKYNVVEAEQSGLGIENNCQYNYIGQGSSDLTIAANSSNNHIGLKTKELEIGEYCCNNTIGNGCERIYFNKAYIENVCVEDGNKNIEITSTQTTSSSNVLRNFIIGRGVNNTTDIKTISHDTVNDTIRTVYEPSGSTIVNV